MTTQGGGNVLGSFRIKVEALTKEAGKRLDQTRTKAQRMGSAFKQCCW